MQEDRRVLFIGGGPLLYAHSIRDVLREMQYDVVEPEWLQFKEQNFITKKLEFARQNFLNEFFEQQNALYIEAARKFKPAFVFVINNTRMTPSFLSYCRSNNIPLFMYCIDSIRWIDKGVDYMQYYDDIFSYEPTDSRIEFRVNKFIKYVPLGYDKAIYKPMVKKQSRKYDICFVGRLEKRRLAVLDKVAEYAYKNNKNMIVYTSIQLLHIPHLWLLPKLLVRKLKYNLQYKYLMKYIVNEPIWGNELVKLYNDSKICLNIHVGTHAGMHTGPNPRTFELLGCRAFQIIDKGHIAETSLVSGKHVVEYENDVELIDYIDKYLQDDSARNAIAEAGYNEVPKYELRILMQGVMNSIEASLTKEL